MIILNSQFNADLFDTLDVEYEAAYGNNPPKIACINHSLTLLPPSSRVLDVGCGSGAPVTQLLSEAGHDVHGFDVSPKMVEATQRRFKGAFSVADMITYQPSTTFAGIFIIFSHLHLDYAAFHGTVHRLSQALEPGGILVVGQMPADGHVSVNDRAWDETKSYVEGVKAPFMGKMFPTFMMSARGQREMLTSMGLEIVYETVSVFQPDSEKCEPEEQQYIIGRRPSNSTEALSPPSPLPRSAAE